MDNKARANLFNGMTHEQKRQLVRDVNNITPYKFSFEKMMKELMK